MVSLKPEKGRLLVAEPSIMSDISFNRSVVLLTEHNEHGSIGFILNKPFDFTLHDLAIGIKSKHRVYRGGPVGQNCLYFIHRIPELIPDSVEISPGVYWGGDFKKVKEIIDSEKFSDNEIRFFLGYSGWSAGQLTGELDMNSWVVINNNYAHDILKKTNASFPFWKEKMVEFGGNYLIWANTPENPSFN